MNQEQDLKTKVAILENKFDQIVTLCTKLENTLDSVQKLSYNMSALIKLHEAKLEQQDVKFLEHQKHIEQVHARFDDHIDNDQKFRDLLKNKWTDEMTDEMDDIESCIKDIKKRVRTIEKWQQYFIGGMIVLGAIFGGGQKLMSLFN